MPRGGKQKGHGTLGGRRDYPARSAKQVTRRKRRMADPRVRDALSSRDPVEMLQRSEEEAARLLAKPRQPHEHSDPPVLIGDPPRYACCAARVPAEALLAMEPTPEPVEQPQAVQAAPVPAPEPPLPTEGDGNGRWRLGQARSMLRQGYRLSHVVHTTGWGTRWLDDLATDEDGYGVREQ